MIERRDSLSAGQGRETGSGSYKRRNLVLASYRRSAPSPEIQQQKLDLS